MTLTKPSKRAGGRFAERNALAYDEVTPGDPKVAANNHVSKRRKTTKGLEIIFDPKAHKYASIQPALITTSSIFPPSLVYKCLPLNCFVAMLHSTGIADDRTCSEPQHCTVTCRMTSLLCTAHWAYVNYRDYVTGFHKRKVARRKEALG